VHVNRPLAASALQAARARVLRYFNERERGRARPINYTVRPAAEINNPSPLLAAVFPGDVNAAGNAEAAPSALIGECFGTRVLAARRDPSRWTDWINLSINYRLSRRSL